MFEGRGYIAEVILIETLGYLIVLKYPLSNLLPKILYALIGVYKIVDVNT